MSFNEKDHLSNQQFSSLKEKQTMFTIQIRREMLNKELRSRRAEQYMSENEVKEILKTKYETTFKELVEGYKDTEEFKLNTGIMKEMLESVSDTCYFNKVLGESGFLEKIIDNFRNILKSDLHLNSTYEDSIEVSMWFLCNAMKYGVGFNLLCESDNFDIIFDIATEIVSAKCLSTFCNLLANFIICLADEQLIYKLVEISKNNYDKILTRLELAMSDISEYDTIAKNLVDSAIFLLRQCKSHLNIQFVKVEVI